MVIATLMVAEVVSQMVLGIATLMVAEVVTRITAEVVTRMIAEVVTWMVVEPDTVMGEGVEHWRVHTITLGWIHGAVEPILQLSLVDHLVHSVYL